VSNPEVAAYTLREREMGASLYAESCPQYFLLREDEIHTCGTLRKFTPPARARTNGDEADMWTLLRQGKLTHMSSDHAPSTMEQKMSGDMWNVHFGLPGLDSTMSILLDAVARGHLQYSDVARVYSEMPADIYGLSETKGRIKVGADADVIVVDPNRSRTITTDSVVSKAGWSPFDGREVRGVVTRTYLRGMLIAKDRQLVAERQGDFILGGGA
jgi:dihydroorotase-like cyclic amidohydrolase